MTNEEVKQQAIKNAYGEYLDICNPDENGWTFYQLNDNREVINGFAINSIMDCEFNNLKQDNAKLIYFVRPLSIKGIDNNNGWIKIESEDFWEKNNEILEFYDSISKKSIIDIKYKLCEFQDKEYRNRFTHYKTIELSKPPIY